MSLRCLALLGSKNEPLYVCAPDPVDGDNDDDGEAAQQMDDVFGFFGASQPDTDTDTNTDPTTPGPIKRPASIRHEIMIHAAIDRIEELIGSHKKTSWKRFQRGSHWVGLICPMEEYDVYGYVTSSDVKIVALLERDGIIPLKKRKEVDIKIMFTAIHNCYVKYTMNPFSEIRGKIEAPCSQFEKRLQAAMNQYNCAVNGN
mmetsp:Transcript_27054/g.63315  ORF Transcript_27054/g.63315 Transcript_27054/m.63315 type:complete len:201 (-) Transcript_27054:237-839(-)